MENKNLTKIKKIESELEKYIESEKPFIKTKPNKSINLKSEMVKFFRKFKLNVDKKDIEFIQLDECLKFEDLKLEYNSLLGTTITQSYYILIKDLHLNLKITVSNVNELKLKSDDYYSIYIHNIF